VKPILTLRTKDGAQLSNADSISFVLGGSNSDVELLANVVSYDLPPLIQRYQNISSELNIGKSYQLNYVPFFIVNMSRKVLWFCRNRR
jgi:hypothetical protein